MTMNLIDRLVNVTLMSWMEISIYLIMKKKQIISGLKSKHKNKMPREEFIGKRLIPMFSKSNLEHFLIKLRLQLVIPSFVRNVKLVLMFIVKLKNKKLAKIQSGNVNSVMQVIKSRLKMKNDHKLMLLITFWNQQLKSKTKLLCLKKKQQLFSALTSQVQWVSHAVKTEEAECNVLNKQFSKK